MSQVDALLERIRARLDLDSEAEQEILAEVRDHLEEAAAQARVQGLDEGEALALAAARFGIDEAGQQLQEAHSGWGTADAVVACALPVTCALVLRWLAFAPDGTAVGWPALLSRPAFWIVALAALLLPALKFERWRTALATWAIFWGLSVLFAVMPAVRW